MERKPSCATRARQAAACTHVMHMGWGPDWTKHSHAQRIHKGLCSAVEKHSKSLTGKGLSKWKGAALKVVKAAKLKNLVDVRRITGAPPKHFGIAPGIPEAPPQNKTERASADTKLEEFKDYLHRTTHGRGANVRNAVGMPYHVDSFRKNRVGVRGGATMFSGVPGDDTFPQRAMKSGQELEAEFPVSRPTDVIFNYGANDAPPENITNFGLRHTPGGQRLFRK